VWSASDGYYKEVGGVRIIPEGSLPQPGMLTEVGPGPCKVLSPNFRELRNGEVRRMPIPRTRVNKGKREGRGCYYAPALCSHMKDVAFWDALPTSLILLAWRDATNMGVVPEPAILEFFSFFSFHRRWSRGHTDVGVRCAAAILAPPLGESWHRHGQHHRRHD
jgi:hypothetical protein